MDHSTISSSIVNGRFLGSKDRVILAGNSPNANLQIHYSSFKNGNEGRKQFLKKSEVTLSGNCTAMELCGIPRQAKTYAAVARVNRQNGQGLIPLVDVETSVNAANLYAHDDKEYALFDNFCPYTSLSFQSDHELLATSTESGEIIVYDLYAGKEVSRVRADPTGVSKVRFTRTGQLVSIGDSGSKAQIKIWDLRSQQRAGLALSISQQLSSRHTPSSSPTGVTSGSRSFSPQPPSSSAPHYTSVCPHPMQDKIMCGTSSGAVAVWDLRNAASSSCMEFQPHHSRGERRTVVCNLLPLFLQYFATTLTTHFICVLVLSVTDLLVHPVQQDIVLTCSADGHQRKQHRSGPAAARGALLDAAVGARGPHGHRPRRRLQHPAGGVGHRQSVARAAVSHRSVDSTHSVCKVFG